MRSSDLMLPSGIDGAWWELEGVSKAERLEEDDHHWRWRKLVGARLSSGSAENSTGTM